MDMLTSLNLQPRYRTKLFLPVHRLPNFLPPYLSTRDLDARNVIPENQMIYEQDVIALQLVPFCFLLCLCPLQNMKVMFCWLCTVRSHTV